MHTVTNTGSLHPRSHVHLPVDVLGNGVCVQFIYTRVRIHRHLMQTQTELGALFGEQSALETTGYNVL